MKRKNKKLLSILLSGCMAVSAFAGMTMSSFAGETETSGLVLQSEDVSFSWYDSSKTDYELSTAADLRGLAAIVNGTAEGIEKDSFAGKTVKLTADISLAEDNQYTVVENTRYGTASYAVVTNQYVINSADDIWTPIGSGTATSNTSITGNEFAGTFDGQNHKVKGIYTGTTSATTGNTATVQGLFGIVTGTVKNVGVSGCITGSIVVGGVVADLRGGTVKNCANDAVIFSDGGTTPNGNIENGLSKGGATGGIVGVATGTSVVAGCVNYSSVICANSSKGGRVGGIIGLVDSTSDSVNITKNNNAGDVDGYQYVGGIIGGNYSKTSPITLCSNIGTITGHSNSKVRVGGMVGECYSNIANCTNVGSIRIIIDGNAGDKASSYAGIVGAFSGAKIENCYNAGERSFGGNATLESSCGTICGTGYGTTAATTLYNCYGLEGITGEDITNAQCVTVLSDGELKNAAALLGSGFKDNDDDYPIPVIEGLNALLTADRSENYNKGDVVTVTAKLEAINNNTVSTASVKFSYDSSLLKWQGADLSEVMSAEGIEAKATEKDGICTVSFQTVPGKELDLEMDSILELASFKFEAIGGGSADLAVTEAVAADTDLEPLYTVLREADPISIVETSAKAEKYGSDYQMAIYKADSLPAEGKAYQVGGTVMTYVPGYASEEDQGKYVFVALLTDETTELNVEEVDGSYQTKESMSGDANLDNKVNIIDAQAVHYMINGTVNSQSASIGWLDADVNLSKTIDTGDARAIQYYVHYGEFGSF